MYNNETSGQVATAKLLAKNTWTKEQVKSNTKQYLPSTVSYSNKMKSDLDTPQYTNTRLKSTAKKDSYEQIVYTREHTNTNKDKQQ